MRSVLFRLLTEAGLPAGVFQTLFLDYKQVSRVIESDIIQYVVFTGSVNGGKSVQTAANQRFIPVGLELGVKIPLMFVLMLMLSKRQKAW